jgi:hypothetical protein
MRDLLVRMGAGTVGGLAATWLMQRSMPLAGRLPARLRPPVPARDPGDYMMALAEKRVGRLSKKMHNRGVQGLHWGYGLAGPLLLAGLARALRLRSPGRAMGAGAAMGALVWAAGYVGWLPATGLTPPVHRVHAARSASSLLSHVAYGAVAALPLALASARMG